mgnify:CR=1 FL=1
MNTNVKYGDRSGDWVYTASPLGKAGSWINVTTGETRAFLKAPESAIARDFKAEKARFIRFIRYLRPIRTAPFTKGFDVGYRNEVDNLRGTTFVIELDYSTKTIAFSYSVCRGDNFEKNTGKHIAMQRFEDTAYVIPMKTSLNTGEQIVNESGVLVDIYQAIYMSHHCSERTKMLKEFHDAGF